MEAKMDAGPRNRFLEMRIRFKKIDQEYFYRFLLHCYKNELEANVACVEINLWHVRT